MSAGSTRSSMSRYGTGSPRSFRSTPRTTRTARFPRRCEAPLRTRSRHRGARKLLRWPTLVQQLGFSAKLRRAIGADRVRADGADDSEQELGVVDGPGVDAQPGEPEYAGKPRGQQEVLDRDAAQPMPRRPGRERLGGVVGEDDQARGEAVSGRDRAGGGMEADHLDSLALPGASIALA